MPSSRLRSLLLSMLWLASSVPAVSHAHFVLEAPAAMTTQNSLGDPQKAPPCGDDGSATATGEITRYEEGSTVRITIQETIFHPGHYRVALAVDGPEGLPAEPPVTPGDSDCGSAPIDPNPSFPVLADGVLLHSAAFDGSQTFEVTLPEGVTCENCTLQILEFMSNHGLNNPGGCYYHHCANIAITPAGTPAGDAGTGGEEMDAGTSPSPDGDDSTPEPGDGETRDGDAADGDAAEGDPADGDVGRAGSSSGGCTMTRHDGGSWGALGVGLLGVLARRMRRRRTA